MFCLAALGLLAGSCAKEEAFTEIEIEHTTLLTIPVITNTNGVQNAYTPYFEIPFDSVYQAMGFDTLDLIYEAKVSHMALSLNPDMNSTGTSIAFIDELRLFLQNDQYNTYIGRYTNRPYEGGVTPLNDLITVESSIRPYLTTDNDSIPGMDPIKIYCTVESKQSTEKKIYFDLNLTFKAIVGGNEHLN